MKDRKEPVHFCTGLIKETVTMLDLRFVRENPEIVKQNIRNKFQDNKLPLVDEVIALDEESRKVKKAIFVHLFSFNKTNILNQ